MKNSHAGSPSKTGQAIRILFKNHLRMNNKLLRAYIYPNTKIRINKELYNPYIDDVIQSFGKYFNFINSNDKTENGILNMFKYFFRTDIIFLNWIENLPDKRLGTLQTLCFIFILQAYKISGKKIIWTVHNKESHNRNGKFLKNLLFRFLLNNSDKIITHASEGVSYIDEMKPGLSRRILFFPHPVKNRLNMKENLHKPIDILIWGTIAEHKALDKFLAYLVQNKLGHKYTIVIIGKIYSPEYESTILNFCNEKIKIENRFATMDELSALINQSRMVLFTYESKFVLSSGALMDTISFGGKVIGPRTGAFEDLEKEGIVQTFATYDELIRLIDARIKNPTDQGDNFTDFIAKYSWANFAASFNEFLFPAGNQN